MKVTVEGGQLPDEPGPFRVEESAPGAPIRVTVTWPVGDTTVSSSAWFIADADGLVDPRRQPSYAGSYTGIDPFGLFWTARAADGSVPLPSGSSEDVDVEVAAVSSESEAVGYFSRSTRFSDVVDVPVISVTVPLMSVRSANLNWQRLTLADHLFRWDPTDLSWT